MDKKVIVKQEEISDCGACCILSIIRYYGGNANLEEIRNYSNTDVSGVNALDIINCLNKYGMNAQGLKTDKIKLIHIPCIAHIKINEYLSHFVVIYDMNEEYITVMDPAKGIIKLQINEFYNIFSDFLIMIIPKTELPQYKTKKQMENNYKNELKKNKYKLLKLILGNFIILVISLLSSLYIKIITVTNKYYLLIIMFIILELMKYLLSINYSKTLNKIKETISSSGHKLYFDFIIRLPLKYIYLKKSGELISRLDELNETSNLFINIYISNLMNSFIVMPIMIVLLMLNYKSFILIFISCILLFFITDCYKNKLKKSSKESLRTIGEYKDQLVDVLNNPTCINNFNCHDYFGNKVNNKYNTFLTTNNNLDLKLTKYIKMIELIENINVLLVDLSIYLSTKNFINIIIVNNCINIFFSNFNKILTNNTLREYYKEYIKKCDELLDLELKDQGTNSIINKDIKINSLQYFYDTKISVINIENEIIKEGEKVIIKGKNGAGKSTLAKIITKQLIDYNGSIKIGNIEIKDIDKQNINKFIIYLSQEDKLLKTTIKENILLGRNINEKELNKIIDICNLKTLIDKLPYQLDTYLFGGGSELSGGERQKILLARAIASKQEILILDESFSEINPVEEIEILDKIEKNNPDKTIIYISHKNLKYTERIIGI